MAEFNAREAADALMALLGRNQMVPLGNQSIGTTPEGRPMIRNRDGSYSTERTITGPWAPNDQWVNIPSMYGGFEYPEDRAVEIMRSNGWRDPDTGRRVQFFPTVDDAETEAAIRSMAHGMQMSPAPWAKSR